MAKGSILNTYIPLLKMPGVSIYSKDLQPFVHGLVPLQRSIGCRKIEKSTYYFCLSYNCQPVDQYGNRCMSSGIKSEECW